MNWDHAVSWGRGVWVSVSDIGRVGQPELKQFPQATRGKKNICCAVNLKENLELIEKNFVQICANVVEAKWVCIIGSVSVFLPL